MILQDQFEEVFSHFGHSQEALLPALKVAQRNYGCIPREVVQHLSAELSIAPLDIYGVISFYGMLSTRGQGKYAIRVCSSLPCHLNEAEGLLRVIGDVAGLRPGETSPDGLFSLEVVGCLGLCDRAPAMLVNDHVHGPLTTREARSLLLELKEREVS